MSVANTMIYQAVVLTIITGPYAYVAALIMYPKKTEAFDAAAASSALETTFTAVMASAIQMRV
jgi:hypothetical protein